MNNPGSFAGKYNISIFYFHVNYNLNIGICIDVL